MKRRWRRVSCVRRKRAHDYRYFPEPDLAPLVVTDDFITNVRQEMPELPEVRRNRFMEQYGLTFADASQLVSDRSLADYYEVLPKSPRMRARRKLDSIGITS
jgi:Asp-tRNA(Asn)/Glu-tRNA(Gln) amidotransferase B subunit